MSGTPPPSSPTVGVLSPDTQTSLPPLSALLREVPISPTSGLPPPFAIPGSRRDASVVTTRSPQAVLTQAPSGVGRRGFVPINFPPPASSAVGTRRRTREEWLEYQSDSQTGAVVTASARPYSAVKSLSPEEKLPAAVAGGASALPAVSDGPIRPALLDIPARLPPSTAKAYLRANRILQDAIGLVGADRCPRCCRMGNESCWADPARGMGGACFTCAKHKQKCGLPDSAAATLRLEPVHQPPTLTSLPPPSQLITRREGKRQERPSDQGLEYPATKRARKKEASTAELSPPPVSRMVAGERLLLRRSPIADLLSPPPGQTLQRSLCSPPPQPDPASDDLRLVILENRAAIRNLRVAVGSLQGDQLLLFEQIQRLERRLELVEQKIGDLHRRLERGA